MIQVDTNHDDKVSFDEFVDSASYLKTESGVSTDGFNTLLRLVAKTYVGKGDDEVRYCIALYCIVLYCIVLYCIALYCIVL